MKSSWIAISAFCALAAMAGAANANVQIMTSFTMEAVDWSGNTGMLGTDTEISSASWLLAMAGGTDNTGLVTPTTGEGLTNLPIGVGDTFGFSYPTTTGTITGGFTEQVVSYGGSTRFFMNIFADGNLREGGSPLADSAAHVVFVFSYEDPGYFGGPAVGYGYVDSIPAPELSTWAMLLLGVAGLGFAGYRRARAGYSPHAGR